MSVISGTISALAQSRASSKASDAQQKAAEDAAEVQMKMYEQSREDFAPFLDVGTNALYELAGYTPVTTTPEETPATTAPTQPKLPDFDTWAGQQLGVVGSPARTGMGGDAWEAEKDKLRPVYNSLVTDPRYAQPAQPQAPAEPVTTWEKTGAGIDPTGGAQQYMDALKALRFNSSVDPTGGAQKYMEALEALNFEFDPNDEVYKWRQKQLENTINQATAARGLWDSRVGINALYDANMALQADEIARQYEQNYEREYGQQLDLYNIARQSGNDAYQRAVEDYDRQYGQQVDLFNTANQLGGQIYNKYLDLAKIGTGAASSAGSINTNTGNQLASIYQNQGNAQAANALQQGQIIGSYMQGIQQAPFNALATYGYGSNLGLWGNG